MQHINPRDLEIRNHIADFIVRHEGMSPLIQEIADGMGLSRRIVEESIKRLHRAGKITRTSAHRSIRVPGASQSLTAEGRIRALERRVHQLEALLTREAAE